MSAKSCKAHPYKARLLKGGAVIVRCPAGKQVRVVYYVDHERSLCAAYVSGVGYIGGWAGKVKATRFKCIVPAINQGKVYATLSDLPCCPP